MRKGNESDTYAELVRPSTKPCRFCGGPTLDMEIPQRECDNCWEVAHRIRSLSIDAMKSILKAERPQWIVVEIPE